MTQEFKIEQDIPIPALRTKWPFANMKPGESVFIVGDKGDHKRAISSAFAMGRARTWKFIVRSEEDGIRIWRTE